jgi:hypothetical protein
MLNASANGLHRRSGEKYGDAIMRSVFVLIDCRGEA